MIKVLHLAIDEKFIDRGVNFFKEDARAINHLLVVSESPDRKHVTSFVDFQLLSSELHKLPVIASAYDILVFHSLHPYFCKVIESAHEKFIVWIGMGFDYYDLIFHTKYHLMMEKTKLFYINHISDIDNNILSAQISSAKPPEQKICLLSKINVFCPVLPSEYEFIVQHGISLPLYCAWNYIYEDLEEVMKPYLFSSNNSIFIGNSADPSNNHLDILSLISLDGMQPDTKIITPLSYGNTKYANLVSTAFKKVFGERYTAVRNFLDLADYMKLLSTANVCIMAHKRQQGMGNIIMMLHLGYKIFMNSESPAYSFLIAHDIKVFPLEDLHRSGNIIANDLEHHVKIRNATLIKQLFSANLNRLRTKKIIDLMEQHVNWLQTKDLSQ